MLLITFYVVCMLFSHSVMSDSSVTPMPGSSVHGISQARKLEWVAVSFSRGSSWPRDQTCISCIGRWSLYQSHLGSPYYVCSSPISILCLCLFRSTTYRAGAWPLPKMTHYLVTTMYFLCSIHHMYFCVIFLKRGTVHHVQLPCFSARGLWVAWGSC